MSDNIAALVYLKNRVHKWKNIALILGIFSLLLTIKFTFGGNISGSIVDGDCIAEVKIEGVIFEDEARSKILKEVLKDDSIKAVIVNINSPGGGIVGSEILFEELRKISLAKPTVVIMQSVAASGGYMAAVAADYIIAHNGTLTGSIGVLMESPEVTELASKIGVKFNTYKSSPLKGSPSPFEKSNSKVDKVINESINDSFLFFSGLVKERRGNKIKPEFSNIVFDGRVFTGRQALKAGLIDEIGGKDQALKYLASKKIDVKSLPVNEVKTIDEENSFFEKFFGILPWSKAIENSVNSNHKIMAIMR